MSQYMICKAKDDLTEFGGILLNLNKKSNRFILSILEQYYREGQYDDIWIIENMEEYCCRQMYYDEYIASDLYFLLNDLYDLCEWMIFWYGDDFEDLDEVYSKDELISYVQHCIEVPCCELYLRVIHG